MLEVIAGVDDDGQVFEGQELGETVGLFRAADPAGEGSDFHPCASTFSILTL